MSTVDGESAEAETDGAAADELDTEELKEQIELLRDENRRLREEYVRARHVNYRRTGFGLGLAGLVAVVGGVAFPAARTVLLILGAIGVFGGILTYFLTPERVVPTSVGQSVYAAFSRTGTSLRDELGLRGEAVYVPMEAGSESVRLFLPQFRRYVLPDDEDLTATFVAPGDERSRGVALVPTGVGLLDEFERAVDGRSADPDTVTSQLCDALTEQFELVRNAAMEVDPDGGRITVRTSGVAYGQPADFDHPAASLLGAGLARRLDRPVTVEVTPGDDSGVYLVTCRWEPDA